MRHLPTVAARIAAPLTLVLACGTALAQEAPTCAERQDDSWVEPETVQERIESLGYTIENVDVSEGNCYAVSGLNVLGMSVTTYLDPRTGDIVQEDVAQ